MFELPSKETMACFWSRCSDHKRCEAHGSCVAKAQAGGATFPQEAITSKNYLHDLPPELDQAGKYGMRAKAARQAPEHDAFGHMSDEWVADRVRMLMHKDLWHEPIYQAARDRIMRLSLEVERLNGLINTPHTHDFLEAVRLEMPHQRERWGAGHDAGKTALDWFWLIGYLAQKATYSFLAGEIEKTKHHVITTAAALGNWFLAITGESTAMRPGIDTPRGENHV